MSNWYWEGVSDLSGAEKAINGGFWAALIVACITALVALFSFAGVRLFGLDAWALFDAVLFAAIAVGIKRKSRFAAVAGLSLYILERIYMIQRSGRAASSWVFFLRFCSSTRCGVLLPIIV
jgi:hypothetical protein